MRTKVAEMLGVEFPICAFSHCRDVVAAVSDAGGFGVLGAVAHSPKRLESELTWIEQQTGGKPYGVDLLLPPKYVGDDRGGIDGKQARELLPGEHRAFVDELLVRYGIPVPADDERLPPGELNISPKYFVGQVVGLTNKVQPAAAVVLNMVAEFIGAVELLDKVVDQ
jgi:NAD(P)H-dependent flavin oxidoreductase YrpB (nitropropane dioxygenase family)